MINVSRPGAPFIAIALALTAGALWGTLGLITRILLAQGLNVTQLGLARLGGAFVLTLVIAAALGRLRLLKLRQWCWLAMVGLICQASGSFAFSSAVAGAGSSLAIVLLCTGPLFTTLFNRLFFKERLERGAMASILLTLVGLILTVTGDGHMQTGAGLYSAHWYSGLCWGLLSGLCYGLFPIFVRALGTLDVWIIVSVSLGFGALFLTPLHDVAAAAFFRLDGITWLWIGALVLIPTVFADVFYVRAIAIGGPMLATLFALIEVPAAAIYAWWWLAVPVTFLQWTGIALFCSGLAGLALRYRHAGVGGEAAFLPTDKQDKTR